MLNGSQKTIGKLFEPDPDKLGGYVTQALFNWHSAAASPAAKPPRRLFNVPRRPDLIGREWLIRELHEMLQAKKRTAVVPALSGQGGVGKTQLAAAYAHDHAADYPGGIFWLVAAETTALLPQLARFARDVPEIDLARRNISDDDKAAEAFLGWLGNEEDALLVLDNVATPLLLAEPVPGLKESRLDTLHCALLITTRMRDMRGCVDLPVDTLGRDDAQALLVREAGRLPTEEIELGRLLDRLGGLPLALRIAGAVARRVGYVRLATLMAEKGLAALDWQRLSRPTTRSRSACFCANSGTA